MSDGSLLPDVPKEIIALWGEADEKASEEWREKKRKDFADGGATKEKVTEAFKIITSDENVKGILVNIFGGIMRCDIIADGVVAAVKEVGLQVPLVVRLEGTNVEQGKEIINTSGLNVIAADNLSDAAEKIVKAVKG